MARNLAQIEPPVVVGVALLLASPPSSSSGEHRGAPLTSPVAANYVERVGPANEFAQSQPADSPGGRKFGLARQTNKVGGDATDTQRER